MRNTNKSPKITYFATVLEVEKSDPKSVSDTRSPLKMDQFFRLIDPITIPGSNMKSAVIPHTDRQKDKPTSSHNLHLGRDNKM